MELLYRINYPKDMYVTRGGTSERMLYIVDDLSWECLMGLAMQRERIVKKHLMYCAGLSNIKGCNFYVELLAQMFYAKKDK